MIRRIRNFGVRFAFACASRAAARAADAVELQALHGRVVYLDFWASWCACCHQSFPWMQSLKETYENRGLSIIAVNLDHDRADAEAFLQRFNPGFQVHFDDGGRWAQRFRVRGMPTSVIIDRHGVPRFTHVGFRRDDSSQYARQIEQLLAEC